MMICFHGEIRKNIIVEKTLANLELCGHIVLIRCHILAKCHFDKIVIHIHAIPHTVRQNLTEFSPFWTPFPIRFSNLTEFSYHLISCFLKNWK